uniref:BCD1 alpha/beta domain-containing protein n=1 Tax=Callorhinchus milii TaxID=7868 RepID=A0A4W3HMK8_CALMI
MTYSCSLSCVKKHKADAECNGVRDKTAFLAVNHFNEMHLLSDYRFLEDSGRLADSANRDASIRRPSSNQRLKFMMYKARKCNIHLRFLPLGFSKRKENSTFFNKKEQVFYWHLKLVFPQSKTEYVEKRVPGSKTLEDILKKYINPKEANPVIRQKYVLYTLISNLYFSLDSSESLTKNLGQKTIIEYPTIHIVLKEHSQQYRLLVKAIELRSSCFKHKC